MTKFVAPVTIGTTAQSANFRFAETNDCVVRAVSNVTGMAYQNAHAIAKKSGRRNRKGCPLQVTTLTMKNAGFSVAAVCGTTSTANSSVGFVRQVYGEYPALFEGITLSRALEQYNEGSYVFIVRGHAIAVVDGDTIDTHKVPAGTRVAIIFKYDGEV